MAKTTTTKRFHTKQMFELLGGDLADLSTNGVPLDSDQEKEITVTVKGDGETEMTQAELDTLVADYVFDPNYGKPAEEVSLKDEIAQRLQTLHDATKDKATWDGLTAAQRQEVTRLTIQGFVKVVRFVAKRFL